MTSRILRNHSPSSSLLTDTLDSGQHLGELLVNHLGQVTSIVEDHVGGLSVGECFLQCCKRRFDEGNRRE